MLDIGIAEILGIISIIISVILGSHIVIHSKCFGCLSVDTSGNEIDVKVGYLEAQITPVDVKLDILDASGNIAETIADIPLKPLK